jgi:hypothetical protein
MRIEKIIKRGIYTLVVLVSMTPYVSAQDVEEDKELHHCYFEEKSISFGIGSSYSLPLDLVGINLRSYYNIGEKLCVGPEFSYFKSPTVEVLEFNAIAHYIIETPLLGISPISGVNYTIENLEHEQEKGFGVALGLGLHRNFDRVTIYTEYITVVGAVPDNFLNLGLMYSFEL